MIDHYMRGYKSCITGMIWFCILKRLVEEEWMNLKLGVNCLDSPSCSWVLVVWMNLVLGVGCLDELGGECRLSG